VLYLSSADWMSRNMFRRIEVAWPVRDPALRQRVIDECLVPYLHDQRDAWDAGRRRPLPPRGRSGAQRPAGADAEVFMHLLPALCRHQPEATHRRQRSRWT
jgi:polyphosphate kinase